MVERPSGHPWSSYRVNAEGHEDQLATPHAEYIGLGNDSESRRKAYQSLFEDALEPPLLKNIREATNGGYPLGSEPFRCRIVLSPGQRLEPGRSGRPPYRDDDDSGRSLEIGL
jgi:putative transposase